MVHSCCVFGCKSHSKKDKVSFHKIPSIISESNRTYNGNAEKLRKMIKLSEKRQKAWELALKYGKLSETQLRNSVVCGKHFISGKPADLASETHPDWIPCKNLGYASSAIIKTPAALSRYRRLLERGKSGNSPDSVNGYTSMECVDVTVDNVQSVVMNDTFACESIKNNTSTVGTQTDIDMFDLSDLMNKLNLTTESNKNLKFEIATSQFNEAAFINDEKKTRFYTGLSSYKTLKAIHENIHPFLCTTTKPTTLTTFQQLTLTLIKLRLNLSFTDLAYRFGVNVKTAVTYFRNVVHILYHRFKNLIHWPDRETLHSTMPLSFKEVFGDKITTIIDCFEIVIEHPSNLASAAACWSHYKHNVTTKMLVGITPQGSVCFISEAWGGRVSDKMLTETSDIMNKILPGDVVLADRGFLIHDAVEALHAKLLMPAFTKGKSQLHPIQLEESRSVAHVRIHIERVIGCLRQIFLILSEKLPITMLVPDTDGNCILDQILVVCSFLFNLNPGVVPLQ